MTSLIFLQTLTFITLPYLTLPYITLPYLTLPPPTLTMRTPTSFRFLSVFFSEYLCLNNAIVKTNSLCMLYHRNKNKGKQFFLRKELLCTAASRGFIINFPSQFIIITTNTNQEKHYFILLLLLKKNLGKTFGRAEMCWGCWEFFFRCGSLSILSELDPS